MINTIKQLFCISACIFFSACSTLDKVQTSALEKVKSVKNNALVQVGAKSKHDLLFEQIEESIALQQETKQYIEQAYDVLANVSDDVGDVEGQKKEINQAYQQSESLAQKLKAKITKVDRTAKTLFIEWRRELRQYNNKNLREKSAQNLDNTKQQYATVRESMQKSYQSIEPLLRLLHDNELYIKHNRSVAAMQGFQSEVKAAGSNIDGILADIETAITDSEAFADVINVR